MDKNTVFQYLGVIVSILFLLYNGYSYYENNKTVEIFNNAKQLNDNYNQQIELKNDTGILIAGEELSAYLNEHREVLDNEVTPKNWASDLIALIEENKIIYEKNQKIRENNKLIEDKK